MPPERKKFILREGDLTWIFQQIHQKSYIWDCSSGISGDMTVGAPAGSGGRQRRLLEALKSLPLEGYRTEITSVTKSGLKACDFHVILDERYENHDHDMAYLHGPGYDSEAPGYAGHEQPEHGHPHQAHSHSHGRNLPDIRAFSPRDALRPHALELALKIFQIVRKPRARYTESRWKKCIFMK